MKIRIKRKERKKNNVGWGGIEMGILKNVNRPFKNLTGLNFQILKITKNIAASEKNHASSRNYMHNFKEIRNFSSTGRHRKLEEGSGKEFAHACSQ